MNESIPNSNLNVPASFSTAGEGFDSRLGTSSLGYQGHSRASLSCLTLAAAKTTSDWQYPKTIEN